MKRILVIFFFVVANIIGCSNQSQGFKIHIAQTEDVVSKVPSYELVVYNNDKIIAKRVFQNGKTILAQGEIPKDFINATTLKVIKDRDTKGNHIVGEIYLQNGRIIAERHLKNNQVKSRGKIPDGIIIDKYDNGSIRNIYVHQNGLKNGPALGFHENGQLKVEVYYIDGFPSGICKIYFENGNLMSESEFVNKKATFHKEYYENGKLRN